MKKLNQQGIGHHLVIAGLAVLVLGVAAFAGWRVYQFRQMDASAQAGWVVLPSTGGVSIKVCKDESTRRVRYEARNTSGSKRFVHAWTNYMKDSGPTVNNNATGTGSIRWTQNEWNSNTDFRLSITSVTSQNGEGPEVGSTRYMNAKTLFSCGGTPNVTRDSTSNNQIQK